MTRSSSHDENESKLGEPRYRTIAVGTFQDVRRAVGILHGKFQRP